MARKIKKVFIYAGIILCALMASSCAGSAAVNSETGSNDAAPAKVNANFNDVLGKDWLLEEFKTGSVTVFIDRTRPEDADIYSLRFDAERAAGKGAPNRYTAPYTKGDGNVLSIGLGATTLMAAIFENKDLREHDYFGYLNKTKTWDLRNGKLELYSQNEAGNEVILVYK